MTELSTTPKDDVRVAVTQADREAAAHPLITPALTAQTDILASRLDGNTLVQAFARHRIAAEQSRASTPAVGREDQAAPMPSGMTRWRGQGHAPQDWDGGPVWVRPGAWLRDPRPYGWTDVLAYTRKGLGMPDRSDIARALFDQRQTKYDFDEAADADPESDAGTLYSIVHDDADAILATLPASDDVSAAKDAEIERLRKSIEVAHWLEAAIECAAFVWDADQYDAATRALAEFRATLPPSPVEGSGK